jgi:molybdopterin-guanine dinucleotide biosynthesis protein A
LLREALSAGLRKVQAFAEAQGARVVTFAIPDGGPDPFLNLNTPEDLATARRWTR